MLFQQAVKRSRCVPGLCLRHLGNKGEQPGTAYGSDCPEGALAKVVAPALSQGGFVLLLSGCSNMGSGPQRGTAFALTHGRRLSADTLAGAVSSSLTKEGAVSKRLSSRAANGRLSLPI